MLNAFFALDFAKETCPQASQVPEQSEAVCAVEEGGIRDLLAHLDVHKSMGPDGMCSRVLKKLADVIVRLLSHL